MVPDTVGYRVQGKACVGLLVSRARALLVPGVGLACIAVSCFWCLPPGGWSWVLALWWAGMCLEACAETAVALRL